MWRVLFGVAVLMSAPAGSAAMSISPSRHETEESVARFIQNQTKIAIADFDPISAIRDEVSLVESGRGPLTGARMRQSLEVAGPALEIGCELTAATGGPDSFCEFSLFPRGLFVQ